MTDWKLKRISVLSTEFHCNLWHINNWYSVQNYLEEIFSHWSLKEMTLGYINVLKGNFVNDMSALKQRLPQRWLEHLKWWKHIRGNKASVIRQGSRAIHGYMFFYDTGLWYYYIHGSSLHFSLTKYSFKVIRSFISYCKRIFLYLPQRCITKMIVLRWLISKRNWERPDKPLYFHITTISIKILTQFYQAYGT